MILALASGCTGCAWSDLPAPSAQVAAYQPANVHYAEPTLAPNVKRVAVLPVATANSDTQLEFGRDTLSPVLVEELTKLQRFEVVAVTSEQLRRLTGRNQWTSAEPLPPDLFASLRQTFGCDAVMLPQLTTYRAYAPLAVGWRIQLIDVANARILWSVDEVFDDRNPAVAYAARSHLRVRPETPTLWGGSAAQILAPRQFGQYSAHAALATLPERRWPELKSLFQSSDVSLQGGVKEPLRKSEPAEKIE